MCDNCSTSIVALALVVEAKGVVPERGRVVVAESETAKVVGIGVKPSTNVRSPPLSFHLKHKLSKVVVTVIVVAIGAFVIQQVLPTFEACPAAIYIVPTLPPRTEMLLATPRAVI